MADLNGVINITDEEFEEVTSQGVSLVDFWAPWCHPCRMQGPVLEKVAATMGEKAKIYKINVDDHRETAVKFGVNAIPCLIILKNGEKVREFVGLQQHKDLVTALESCLN